MKHRRPFLALCLAISLTLGLAAPTMAAEGQGAVTREYAVSQFVQAVGRSWLVGNTAVLGLCGDGDQVDEAYAEDMARAISNGIIRGDQYHNVYPKGTVSRAEALVMLSRCLERMGAGPEPTGEPVAFTDVPVWAKAEIDKLSAMGIVQGLGDGTVGAADLLTADQLALLTRRVDEACNTTTLGETFYGYMNDNTFRNADINGRMTIDAAKGAVTISTGHWMALEEGYKAQVRANEHRLMEQLLAGELERTPGSAEQRIYDLISCLAALAEKETDSPLTLVTDVEAQRIQGYRARLQEAKTVDELMEACGTILEETGLCPLVGITVGSNDTEGGYSPTLALCDVGAAGVINYMPQSREALGEFYHGVVKSFFTALGREVTDAQVDAVIDLQTKMSLGKEYVVPIMVSMLSRLGLSDELDSLINEYATAMVEAHPSYAEEHMKAMSIQELDKALTHVPVAKYMKSMGMGEDVRVLVKANGNVTAEQLLENMNAVFTQENLESLKLIALMDMANSLWAITGIDEYHAVGALGDAVNQATTWLPGQEPEPYEPDDAEVTEDSDTDDIDALIEVVRSALPDDMGVLYYNHCYDPAWNDQLKQMVKDVQKAYVEMFQACTWMDEPTRSAAIAKIENMQVNVGNEFGYPQPTITSPADGGTFYGNILAIQRDNTAYLARLCSDRAYCRTCLVPESNMYLDTMNCYYMPTINSINILPGFMFQPAFDPNASYAANLGSIGVVIGHEIGHAFDTSGSQFDSLGAHQNWWSETAAAEYQKRAQGFVDYYADYDIAQGVAQSSEVTIGENMADFSGMSAVMWVLKGDLQGQKEALEAYARMWAHLGENSYLITRYTGDIHSANSIRVDAVISSTDAFYQIYGVKEGERMYVAPESRLKLW